MPQRWTPLITSIGVEIEFANLSTDDVKRDFKLRDYWKVVRDGTCSHFKVSLPNGEEIVIRGGCAGEDANQFGLKGEYVGGEFVSPIINIEKPKWYDDVIYIIDLLKNAKEGIDLRTGIHVHVNVHYPPLFVLHNLLKLGLSIEAPMFRLGCAELGFHRGSEYEDYKFCRPISKFGPHIVTDTMDKYRPVFDANKLLNCKSVDEFFIALGRLDIHGGNKYNPQRYVWLNLASVPLHRTIEFRIFNSTLEHDNVIAWVELCSHIVSYCFGKDVTKREFPLGNREVSDNNEYSFDDFLTDICLTDDELSKKLEHLWSLGSFQREVKGYQKSHLNQTLDLRGLSEGFIKDCIADPIDKSLIIKLQKEDSSPTASSRPREYITAERIRSESITEPTHEIIITCPNCESISTTIINTSTLLCNSCGYQEEIYQEERRIGMEQLSQSFEAFYSSTSDTINF